jgi:hypothetical protein
VASEQERFYCVEQMVEMDFSLSGPTYQHAYFLAYLTNFLSLVLLPER